MVSAINALAEANINKRPYSVISYMDGFPIKMGEVTFPVPIAEQLGFPEFNCLPDSTNMAIAILYTSRYMVRAVALCKDTMRLTGRTPELRDCVDYMRAISGALKGRLN